MPTEPIEFDPELPEPAPRPPRKCPALRVLTWASASVTVLLSVIFLLSIWVGVTHVRSRTGAVSGNGYQLMQTDSVGGGLLVIDMPFWMKNPADWNIAVFESPGARFWPPTFKYPVGLCLPLWIPALAGAGLTGGLAALRRRRTMRPEHCVACGYNLTGNISGICPECGAPK